MDTYISEKELEPELRHFLVHSTKSSLLFSEALRIQIGFIGTKITPYTHLFTSICQ